MIGPRTLQGRLALVFGATTVALAGVVGVVASRATSAELLSAVDDGLETRLSDLDVQLSRFDVADPSRGQPVESAGGAFAQILTPDGAVFGFQPDQLRHRPLLTAEQLARARQERYALDVSLPPLAGEARLLAGPSGAVPGWVLVAGTSLDEAARAQDRLRLALGLGLPVLAAAVAAGGWLLAGAALHPVRRMVEEADAISASEPERRLTVPEGAGQEIVVLVERLNDLLGRVERALRRERAFVDDASHELRTPLAIARGELELARMATPDGSPSATAVESSLEEVARLERLAQNLLVLARVAGRRAGGSAPVELGALAARAVAALDAPAAARGVAVHVEGDGTVRGDAGELERALVNLVDNAVRHAATTVWVRITSAGGPAVDGRVVVDVVDDGPGFPPELLPRAFDRFATGGARGGAGLGLAIVAAIASAHGGEAAAGNGAGGGAWVRLRLPASAVQGDEAQVAGAPAG